MLLQGARGVPQAIAQLIDDCMEYDPDKRPSAVEAYAVLRRCHKAQLASVKARGSVRRATHPPLSLPPTIESEPTPNSQPGGMPAKVAAWCGQPRFQMGEAGRSTRWGRSSSLSGRCTSLPSEAMAQLLQDMQC